MQRLPLWQGERDEVALGVSEDLLLTLPRGGFAALTTETQLPASLLAPVARGQPLGRLILRHGNRALGERSLVALDSVPEGSLLKRTGDRLRRWWHSQGSAQAAP
jgi:D-alanyl-D-alanine carboxypeptidase (penicillin-binding protein 5/6)